MNADRVLIEGLTFFGYHGVRPEEQRLGQKFRVDVELTLDLGRAASSDRVADTVNYEEICRLVLEVGKGRRCNLVETLAERIATVLLKAFPAQEVLVRVKKTSPPFDGTLTAVGVEIRRRAPWPSPTSG
ncbi:MAG: dihydroneopterin aldolase [candidate division NC10 bacterium]|nr:dihydroneopterin aldolase [candidate division NC10 bacterium]MBI4414585.1 dihydroneopterin aldolase [candidate division NC10 bacterium]